MKTKRILYVLPAVCLFVLTAGFVCLKPGKAEKPKILIYSETNGFRHDNIATGVEAITKLGQQNGFDVEASEDSTVFTPQKLKEFKAILFLNPTGNILNAEQRKAFQDFIHNGGGFMGIHSATDCMYDFPWYNKLVGAWFLSHPKIQEASLIITDKKHPATKGIASPWKHTDEWYNFKNFNPDVKVIMKVDESSYQGGVMKDFHPISWYHTFEGGKVFYTEIGHTKEDFTSDPIYLKHIQGGIDYVLGRKK